MNDMREKLGTIFVRIIDGYNNIFRCSAVAALGTDTQSTTYTKPITRTSGIVNIIDGVEYVCTLRLRWKHGPHIVWSYLHLFEDDDYNRWVEYVHGSNPITSAQNTDCGRSHFAYNVAIVPWLNDNMTNEEIQEYANEEDEEIDPEDAPLSQRNGRQRRLPTAVRGAASIKARKLWRRGYRQ